MIGHFSHSLDFLRAIKQPTKDLKTKMSGKDSSYPESFSLRLLYKGHSRQVGQDLAQKVDLSRKLEDSQPHFDFMKREKLQRARIQCDRAETSQP